MGVALLLLATACTAPTPARIVAGRTDTLVIHHRPPIALPVVAVKAAGDALAGVITSLKRVSGDDGTRTDRGALHDIGHSAT